MKVAVLCGQVQPVWPATYSFYGTKKCHLLQVRPGLQYATANSEDGARVDVYASGFSGGKQAFF